MWEWTADALGNRFHIHAPDQRGHGHSGHSDGDYSPEEYAEDLRLFMEEVGGECAILIGHPLGGRVAQVFAGKFPEKVSMIGLIAGPHLTNFLRNT